MRVLVVGTGSAGRRHAGNAATLAEVAVYDSDAARARSVADEFGVTAFTTLDEALADPPAAAIVATPTVDHAPIATRLLAAGCDVLVEKPLADSLPAARRLVQQAADAGRRLFVGCNMRFHPGPRTLREHLPEVGTPLFARAHFGHWLPNMRPDSDYRSLYCARRDSGGGVVLDGIHELDYMTWLLGAVAAVSGDTARLSSLDIEVEDYAVMTLTHASGARSEIHLDYLQQCKRRGAEIIGTDGTLLWESRGKSPEHCRVQLYRRDEWVTLYESPAEDANAGYVTMLKHFIDAVDGESPPQLLDGVTAADELAVALAVRDKQPLSSVYRDEHE